MYPPSFGRRRQHLHFVWQLQRINLGEPGLLESGSCHEHLVGVAREEAAEDLESFLGQLRLGLSGNSSGRWFSRCMSASCGGVTAVANAVDKNHGHVLLSGAPST